jgi:hypothetical protein
MVPLNACQMADIRKLEQRLGITVKGYWIACDQVDPSSLDKRARQRRRDYVVVPPGQMLWLDARKRPGELLRLCTNLVPGQLCRFMCTTSRALRLGAGDEA